MFDQSASLLIPGSWPPTATSMVEVSAAAALGPVNVWVALEEDNPIVKRQTSEVWSLVALSPVTQSFQFSVENRKHPNMTLQSNCSFC